MTVKVFGVNKAMAFLTSAGRLVDGATKKGVEQATLYVEGQVKDSVSGRSAEPMSVDTGRFLGSIESKTRGKTGAVLSDVEYASVLEYGNSKRVGRKHFRNTMARSKSKIDKFIRSKIKKVSNL